jgi:hypothetical protein
MLLILWMGANAVATVALPKLPVAPLTSSVESCDMAGVEGFEPPNGGIKTRCLTTWRHPTA